MKIQKSIPHLTSPLLIALGPCLIYWIYLWCTVTPQVLWDSLDYECLGKMFYQQGWIEFFKTGPNREPLYPFLISLAMRAGELTHLHYLKALVLFQLICLFATQLFVYKLFKLTHVSDKITTACLLYIGFSPAIVNFALSVYSEILILPFIPLAIWLCYQFFNQPPQQTLLRQGLYILGLSILFFVMTLIKGVFELTTPLFFIAMAGLWFFRIKNRPQQFRFVLSIISILLVYAGLTFGYKAINQHYNGVFTITNRGPWALYGFTARRTAPLTAHQWLAAIATLPGEGACRKLLGPSEDCTYWHVSTSDSLGMTKLSQLLSQGWKGQSLDQELMRLSKEKLLQRPFQYSLLAFLEGTKVFFWESTQMAFVLYPKGLEYLFFELPYFNNGLRIFWASLSIIGFFYLCIRLLKPALSSLTLISTLLLALLISYSFSYAIFWMNTRYALPMAPLFILAAGIWAQRYTKW